MKILIGTSICLFAAISTAQIPMSAYATRFVAPLTRGFYFQAPANFTVTHLQVPDEIKQGRYLVALYRLSSPPPEYTKTINVKPVFYAQNVNSLSRVATGGIAFRKGDWLAVLGAAGNPSGNIVSSYGAAASKSFVCGQPVTLYRCGIQANIGGTRGVGSGKDGMWGQKAGRIGRVRIWIRNGSDNVRYCNPSTLELVISDPQTASLGNTAAVVVKSRIANNGTVLGLGLGRVNKTSLPFAGRLCIGPIFMVLPLPRSAPATIHQLGHIPNTKTLVGTKIRLQAGLNIGFGMKIPLSNGLELTIGN